MENIYISLTEGTRPQGGIMREFDRNVLTKSFDQIIDDIVHHTGDDLNQEYTSSEKNIVNSLGETYRKGKEHGSLSVAYMSCIDNSPREASLTDSPSQYDDFLSSGEDLMELGSSEYGKASVVIKNNTIGG